MPEVVAQTERLRLRTWGPGDRDEFSRVTNTPAVMRWLGGVADRATMDAAFDRIDGFQRDFGHTFWIVERREDDALLGFCGLKRVNAPGGEALHGQFEIGWRLREDAWGLGYAKEAAIASLDLAFDRYGAPFVIALTVPGNAASQGLMRRLGMNRRGDLDFIDTRFASPGELNPSIVHRIEAGDWPAARAAALA
ncbi:GNAT family N-acetyltransferase [Sphingomonas sp. BN140010]|uniref:GNAT family N-acetyltransferase n=1 Tax=Sphingomonas arvum TaxID=2992113 RepID=A0ABT3JCG9_9SPHN|nr:GNAT family N-acetyltransferase [Sphingomonas sp. BN140010]MCW3796778.1 GNAT family N-acetyltransferase [Sphingomonas sp. BN140010]